MESAKTKTFEDRCETIALMEPMLVDEGLRLRTGLTDLAVELAGRAASLRHGLPGRVLTAG